MHLVTFSGRRINPGAPRPEDIDLQDIAYSLSKEERFGGHTILPYSVAQHSVACVELYLSGENTSKELARAILLHDASEAYLGDVITPIKALLPDYKRLEETWMEVIGRRFGIDPRLFHCDELKEIDRWAMTVETLCLASHAPTFYGFSNDEVWFAVDTANKKSETTVLAMLQPLTPPKACRQFLAFCKTLEIE